MTTVHQHDDRANFSTHQIPAQADAATSGLKVLYLTLAQQAIVDQVLAVEAGLERAQTLLAEGGASRKLSKLAEEFVRAHGFYSEGLSTQVRHCSDKRNDSETRWLGWNTGALLAGTNLSRAAETRRISGELQIQAKDPSCDRLFETRSEAYEAFISAADKDAARHAKVTPAKAPVEPVQSGSIFSGLRALVRV